MTEEEVLVCKKLSLKKNSCPGSQQGGGKSTPRPLGNTPLTKSCQTKKQKVFFGETKKNYRSKKQQVGLVVFSNRIVTPPSSNTRYRTPFNKFCSFFSNRLAPTTCLKKRNRQL